MANDKEYLRQRREQAEREAKGSTLGAPVISATGTVTNPPGAAEASPSAAPGEGAGGGASVHIGPEGDTTVTDSPAANRTTRETGERKTI